MAVIRSQNKFLKIETHEERLEERERSQDRSYSSFEEFAEMTGTNQSQESKIARLWGLASKS